MAQVPVGSPTSWVWSTIGTNELADGAVTGPKVAAGAIGASQLADGAVGTSKLADSSVTDPKIVSVSGSKVSGDISGKALATETNLTNHADAKTGTHGVGTAYIAKTTRTDQWPAWADIPDKPSTFTPSAHASTHHSGGSDALSLGSIAGQIGTNQIADGAVTGPKVAAGAIGASQLADGSVGTSKLADQAVTPQKLSQTYARIFTGATLPTLPGTYQQGDLFVLNPTTGPSKLYVCLENGAATPALEWIQLGITTV